MFDAHARAFVFFGGVSLRGIHDSMKTALTMVFTGKDREFMVWTNDPCRPTKLPGRWQKLGESRRASVQSRR